MEAKKLSSYQKMKQQYEAQIQQLTDDIQVLVENENITRVTVVKLKYQIKFGMEQAIWKGSFEIEDGVFCHASFAPYKGEFSKENNPPAKVTVVNVSRTHNL
jgi:hypothetical protein